VTEPLAYVGTLRIVFTAKDYAEAFIVAEDIREAAEKNMDTDEGDHVDLTQLTDNPLEITPDEILIVLRKARNQLIRTRVRWAVDQAQELDRSIWLFANRAENEPDYVKPYPHAQFLDLMKAIIKDKENPIDY